MNRRSIARKQTQILKKIRECPISTKKTRPLSVPKDILSFSLDEIYNALGDMGLSLRRFLKEVDIDSYHPDLPHMMSGYLIGEFCKECVDLVKLVLFGRANGISEVLLQSACRTVLRSDVAKLVDVEVDAPSVNMLRVRFVSDRTKRDEIRKCKRPMVVSLNMLYKTGQDMWDSTPDSFDSYSHGCNSYENDMQKAKDISEHLNSLNLSSMLQEVKESVSNMEHQIAKEQYLGFNLLPMSVASIILGKLHGYHFSTDPLGYGSGYGERYNVYVREDHFEGFDLGIGNSNNQAKLEYWPIAYTLEDVKNIANKRMKELIDLLEEFPAIGGKSLFDHYRVLLPGLKHDNKNLDTELFEAKHIVGVLLGERDGENYFISYFL